MSYDDIPVVAAEEDPDLMEEVPEVRGVQGERGWAGGVSSCFA
jgi:hypothetical protein